VAARQAAAAILSQRRFGSAPLPNPIATVFDKLGRLLSDAANAVPGGPPAFWGASALLALALALLGARRMMRVADRATRALRAPDTAGREDPQALERRAREAEAPGEFGEAVRLRFRAGLLTLAARRLIDDRPSLLTREAARAVRSPQFDALATNFERIAYGRLPADAQDATAAREGWRALLSRSAGR
jgi:hypothetical protein